MLLRGMNALEISCLVLERINNDLQDLQPGFTLQRIILSKSVIKKKFSMGCTFVHNFKLLLSVQQQYEKFKCHLNSNKYCALSVDTSGSQIVLPREGRSLFVYTDIPLIEEYLKRPEFALSSYHSFRPNQYVICGPVFFCLSAER